jgi:hypothetical protein
MGLNAGPRSWGLHGLVRVGMLVWSLMTDLKNDLP